MYESNELRYTTRLGVPGVTSELRCGCRAKLKDFSEHEFVTPQYAVLYVVRGGGVFVSAQGHSYSFQQGAVLQRFPNQVHSILWEDDSAYYFIGVPANVWQLMSTTLMPGRNQCVFGFEVQANLVDRFERLIVELANQKQSRLMVTLTAMQQLIVDLLVRCQSYHEQTPLIGLLEEACRLLGERVATRFSMPALADELEVNYSTFRKAFTDYLGISPGEYVIRLRIERSQRLLQQGKSVSEIAEQLGYLDVFTFSAQFKKFTGHSPRRYRQMQGL